MKQRLICALLLAAACVSGPALARGGASEASVMLPAASGLVVLGSMSMLAGSAGVVVTAVEAAGEGTVLVLKGVSNGATASVRLSGEAARAASVAAGTVVEVSAYATGYLLVASGKAIAFVPNEIGTAMLHHSRVY